MRGTAIGAALGGALIAATAPGRVAHGRDTMQTKPCGSAEYHQFDFFAGDWDAYDVDTPTKVVARNRVTPMLDGCALREVYEEPGGHKGESFSTYDVGRRRWHQSWVTNDGQILQLDGHLDGNRMVLTATETLATGTQRLVRGIWYPDSSGVRETGERSSDGGKTWTPVRHHLSASRPTVGQSPAPGERRSERVCRRRHRDSARQQPYHPSVGDSKRFSAP